MTGAAEAAPSQASAESLRAELESLIQRANQSADGEAWEELLRFFERLDLTPYSPEEQLELQLTQGEALMALGRYAELRALSEGLGEASERLEAEHPLVFQAEKLSARVAIRLGRYEEARRFLEGLVPRAEEDFGALHEETIQLKLDLMETYEEQHLHQRALPIGRALLRQTETLEGRDQLLHARALVSMSHLSQQMGDSLHGQQMTEEALRLRRAWLEESHPLVQDTLNSLASFHFYAKDFEAALELMDAQLRYQRQQQPPLLNSLATALNNVAQIYRSMGRLEEAVRLQLERLEILRGLHPEGHPDLAHAHQCLSFLHIELEDYQVAADQMREGYDMLREQLGDEHPSTARAALVMSSFYRLTGQREQAMLLYRRVLDAQEQQVQKKLAMGNPRQKRAFLAQSMESFEGILQQHWLSFEDDPESAELAMEMILQRKGREIEAEASVISELRKELDPDALALLRQLQSKSQRLETLFRTQGMEELSGEQRRLLEEVDSLQIDLADHYPQAVGVTRGVRLADVQAQLEPGEKLLEIVQVSLPPDPSQPSYVAYLVGDQGLEAWARLGSSEEVHKEVDLLRAQLQREVRLGFEDLGPWTEEAASRLYDRLLGPFASFLVEAEHLIVSPAGRLTQIPFDVLMSEGRYLDEERLVTMVSSGREVVPRLSPVAPQPQALIMAGIDFGGRAPRSLSGTGDPSELLRSGSWRQPEESDEELRWQPLQGTVSEGRAIHDMIDNSELLTGEDASESALRFRPQPAVLHIATHGFFHPLVSGDSVDQQLLYSGIVLAGANRGAAGTDNGYLSAGELIHMDLRGWSWSSSAPATPESERGSRRCERLSRSQGPRPRSSACGGSVMRPRSD